MRWAQFGSMPSATVASTRIIGSLDDDEFLRLSGLRQQVVTRVRELTGGVALATEGWVRGKHDWGSFRKAFPTDWKDRLRRGSQNIGDTPVAAG